MQATYELDILGTNPNNFIEREPHALYGVNELTNNVLVPQLTPFYSNDFKLEYQLPDGSFHPLVEGEDYELTLPWYSLEKETGKRAYGAARVIRKPTAKLLTVTYRTVGGKYAGKANALKMALADYVWNPRIVQFDQITNIQETFPPNEHKHQLENVVGWDKVAEQIEKLTQAMAQPTTPTLFYQQQMLKVMTDHNELRRLVEELRNEIYILRDRVSRLSANK